MSLIPWSPWRYDDPFYRPGALKRWTGWDDDDFWSPAWPSNFHSFPKFPKFIERQLATVFPEDTPTKVNFGKDKFTANIDFRQQFAPHEITVRTTGDNTIEVEGKHEERPNENGYVSKHFVTRYVLPKGHDVHQAVSQLSSDGVLTITAPKERQIGSDSRIIPIQHTGPSYKSLENKTFR